MFADYEVPRTGTEVAHERAKIAVKDRVIRAPQRKISDLAEFFRAIWDVDGHEHVQRPGSR